MSLIANNKNIADVYVDGKAVGKVCVDGLCVLENSPPPGHWTEAWSGVAMIVDFDENSIADGIYTHTHEFTDMSRANLNGFYVQAEAEYREYVYEIDHHVGYLTPVLNDYKAVNNLPWQTGGFLESELSELSYSGNTARISATCGIYLPESEQDARDFKYGYFIVNKIVYYKPN